MKDKKWVQHISKQGNKYELLDNEWNDDPHETWEPVSPLNHLRLPRTEYILYDPPETWFDVTDECTLRTSISGKQQIWHKEACIDGATGYRFSLVDAYKPNLGTMPASASGFSKRKAFIVEKRSP